MRAAGIRGISGLDITGASGGIGEAIARRVIGLILLLAANTAFNGFPVLASVLAKDEFMPRQMTTRGDRLAFSNGVLLLAVFSIALIVAFDAQVTRLIQLYIVGVFVSFTMSQTGMVIHWTRRLRVEREGTARRRMQTARIINSVGLSVTATVLVVVLITKFTHGAWIAILAMAVCFVVMKGIRSHYRSVTRELTVEDDDQVAVVDPFVAAFHPVPKLAILPLIMVLVGIGETSKVLLVAVASFFPMAINTYQGVKNVDPNLIEVGRAYDVFHLAGQLAIQEDAETFRTRGRDDAVAVVRKLELQSADARKRVDAADQKVADAGDDRGVDLDPAPRPQPAPLDGPTDVGADFHPDEGRKTDEEANEYQRHASLLESWICLICRTLSPRPRTPTDHPTA